MLEKKNPVRARYVNGHNSALAAAAACDKWHRRSTLRLEGVCTTGELPSFNVKKLRSAERGHNSPPNHCCHWPSTHAASDSARERPRSGRVLWQPLQSCQASHRAP